MAWTAPMTFVAGSALTAAQLNTHLRDNLLETSPAKATQSGSLFVGSGTNSIVERMIKTARVYVSESTTSTTYADLATTGPTVTCDTGTNALIFVACHAANTTSGNGMALMSWELSGATTRTAWDATAVEVSGITANTYSGACQVDFMTSLTPGSNTFASKYRCVAGTATFTDRFIGVLPL